MSFLVPCVWVVSCFLSFPIEGPFALPVHPGFFLVVLIYSVVYSSKKKKKNESLDISGHWKY